MILADLVGDARQPFEYRDKGSMATIGKRRAVAEIGTLRLTGRIAWLTWLAVHLYSLIGFRNRLSVMFNWVWAYVFSRREARLIVGKEWRKGGRDFRFAGDRRGQICVQHQAYPRRRSKVLRRARQ